MLELQLAGVLMPEDVYTWRAKSTQDTHGSPDA